MKNITLFAFFLCLSLSLPVSAAKTVYIPTFITSENMDLDDTSSQWCYDRSKETDNVVIFWESGFGSNPSTAASGYQVNIDTLLSVAEKSYSMYLDTLKFAIKGSSVTDKYKLMIFLLYTTEWAAYGSGQDDSVGTLHVNPDAANYASVVAHEIGHCFEYITGCDSDGGYQYVLGNGTGNCFWEQCAQWMCFKVYPDEMFTNYYFSEYVTSNHLNILHETPLYANYFLPEYWSYKHGKTFLGKLWRESKSPEDPVETYERLNSITQAQFNDEIYDHAARLTTWDLPDIITLGENYIDSRGQVDMSQTSDKFWLIDSSVCIENYGYNSIKLNPPSQATSVSVTFKGKAGASGFRKLNTSKGGWRYGFVALLKDGTREYSDMGTANVENDSNPVQTLTFSCPANCSNLWLVVSGAPQEHWTHDWDDDNSDDEQWPYEVQFSNTNLLGETTETVSPMLKNSSVQIRPVISKGFIYLPEEINWQITDLVGKKVKSGYGKSINIDDFSNAVYILHYSGMHLKLIKSTSKMTMN